MDGNSQDPISLSSIPKPCECCVNPTQNVHTNNVVNRARAWVFTIYGDPTTYESILATSFADPGSKIDFIIGGSEVCPSTGRPHLQGFVYFHNARTRSAVSKFFGGCFVAISRDDPGTGYAKAIGYCTKSGTSWQFGTCPASQVVKGKKGGMDPRYATSIASAKQGAFEDIEPDIFLRYYNTLRKIQKDFAVPPPDSLHVTGVWIQGPAGCGKSVGVRKLLGNDFTKFYSKKRATQWWDSYLNQPYVLVEDVDPYCKAMGGHYKDWADRYTFMGETKGSATYVRPKLVFFTSQYSISDIWDDQETVDALRRRCVIINMFNQPAEVIPSLEDLVATLTSRNDPSFSVSSVMDPPSPINCNMMLNPNRASWDGHIKPCRACTFVDTEGLAPFPEPLPPLKRKIDFQDLTFDLDCDEQDPNCSLCSTQVADWCQDDIIIE